MEVLQKLFSVLIFYKQKVSFRILPEDLDGLFCHLHNGWISCDIPKNLKLHVLGLKKTWNHRKFKKKIRLYCTSGIVELPRNKLVEA